MPDPDYRTMFTSDYWGAWDLEGQDVVVTMRVCVAGELKDKRGTVKKPIVYFEGHDKGMVINKTNGATIAGMYGPRVSKWVGKQVTLYPTTTEVSGEQKDCIRVRPGIPEGGK